MSDQKSNSTSAAPAPEMKTFGLLAEYGNALELLNAAEKVRDAGFKKWDTHTPFPVHGIDEAMGINRTILPKIVLACGLTGGLTGLLLQWWTSSVYYPVIVSGKPMFSIPAFIPITFEMTILFSAIGAVFGMLALNGLPRFYHGVFNSKRFNTSMTTDKFYISIEAADPKFKLSEARSLLESTKPAYLEVVEEPAASAIPEIIRKLAVPTAALVLLLSMIPPALVLRSWTRTSDTTRLQLIWDMDQQPRFRSQMKNPIFADGRAMRPAVPGAVARGEEMINTHLYQGLLDGKWAKSNALPVNEALIKRGQSRFNIYCAQCHGIDGYGQGIVAQRAEKLQEGTWVAPLSMHDQVVKDREDGHIFNTITHGIRTMPAYGDQIKTEDRWAIIAYVRALERSQDARIEDVPQERRGELP